MTIWLLTVWLTYGDVNQVWLTETYNSEAECRRWQAFYREYPFSTECKLLGVKE